jgi:predicted GNAT superfamily acetyltransferase
VPCVTSRAPSRLADAQGAARTAAERSRVQIRELLDASAQADARRIFDEVWPTDDGATQVRPNLLRALVHAGGYCVGAYDLQSGDILGATVAFVGKHEGTIVLHSHMSAVVDSARNRHIGTAMKLHQRAWAWERDIPVVTWTFDPLVRKNAYVNLCKLGIQVSGYHVNFYGEMNDAINAGDPTDRLVAWWPVDSQRADRAAEGVIVPVSHAQAVADGARIVAIPEDIVALRTADPASARAWRLTVRRELQAAFAAGWQVDGITDDGGYVLVNPLEDTSS